MSEVCTGFVMYLFIYLGPKRFSLMCASPFCFFKIISACFKFPYNIIGQLKCIQSVAMSKKFGPTANTSTVMCTFVLKNLNKLNTQLKLNKQRNHSSARLL